MAAIDEGDKVRTIYDGSWGGANTHIQNNTYERTTAPTVLDCVQALQWLRISPAPGEPSAFGDEPQGWVPPLPNDSFMLLKADVTKAHRRVKVLAQDWRYQVAQIEGQWWVNTVGTYGMASAQLYWGRLAALLLRLVYLMVPSIDWGFVFVDDFCWILRESSSRRHTAMLLLILLALGTPLSWKKTKLALVNLWLGFHIDPKGPIVTMGPDKHEVVMHLLEKLAQGDCFTSKEIERALGRISWATTICPMTRAFLQPFWAWKVACKTQGKPGKIIRHLCLLLLAIFKKPFVHPSPYMQPSKWWGASDASASSHGQAYIGGWLTDKDQPSKDEVLWFQLWVDPALHPWAFKDGDPSRRIAALEMLGTLILTYFLLEKRDTSLVQFPLDLVTDNQGNAYSLLSGKSRTYPCSTFLMQLVLLLYNSGTHLSPSHRKRDFNRWADELTHPLPHGFTSSLQLDLHPCLRSFTLLQTILPDPSISS